MTSRRSFLAQSGLVAAGLFAPSLARACGRRRRRSTCCAPVVEPRPCDWCGEVHAGRPRVAAAPGPDGLQNCAWVCPRDFFGELNGIFYYYCICCPNNTCCVNACDGVSHSLCTDCNGSGCFLIGRGPP